MKKLFNFYNFFTLVFIVSAAFYGYCGDYTASVLMLVMLFTNWVCRRLEELQTEKFHLQQQLFRYQLLQQLTANPPKGDRNVE